ncbi:MAG: hypothetical protein FWD77_12025, partial [Betaproteobacteria bacterium]|nr:hypothetical protein [Betaproteobacteria bacterium]
CGVGRSAALQILAIATAMAAVCALHPIPIRSAHLPLDLFRVSLEIRHEQPQLSPMATARGLVQNILIDPAITG